MIGNRHRDNVDFMQLGVTGNFSAVASEHTDRLGKLNNRWSESIDMLRTKKKVIKKLFTKYEKSHVTEDESRQELLRAQTRKKSFETLAKIEMQLKV